MPTDLPMPVSEGLRTLSDFTSGIDERDELVAQVVAYRILGYTTRTIADCLCLSPQAVCHYLAEARERAQSKASIARLLDDHALPMAADNLIEGLKERDKEYTLATLKGRGAFTAHTKSEATKTETRLEVQVSMPPGADGTLPALDGQIVGIPRKELGE